jgi:hypothetical protein
MMRLEITSREVTIHVDEHGAEALATGAEAAKAGNKVFFGDPGAMLIIRPEGWKPADDEHGRQ